MDPETSAVPPSGIDFVIVPSRVFRLLLVIISVLVALSVGGQAVVYLVPDFPLRDSIADLFYVNSEQSVPTLYSSVMLVASAILLAIIAYARRRNRGPYPRHWAALSLVFAFLALDESASLHEKTVGPMHALLNIGPGPLWYAWVVPAIVAVAVFVVAFVPFLRHLPRPTRRGLWTAGTLFVGGAIGLEMVGGWYDSVHGQENMVYILIATVEETLEMAGVAVFIHTLLAYVPVGLSDAVWRLRIASRPTRPHSASAWGGISGTRANVTTSLGSRVGHGRGTGEAIVRAIAERQPPGGAETPTLYTVVMLIGHGCFPCDHRYATRRASRPWAA